MRTPSRDVVVLAAGQALTSTVVSLLTSVSSLSGAQLAPAPALATVPVTASVLGTLAMIYPASALMGLLGRRGGFMVKAGIGVLGGIVCFAGLAAGSFAILVTGAFLLGLFSAFGQYYRFAAIDAARDPEDRATAIAVVTGAGVAGGVAAPFSVAASPTRSPACPMGARSRRSPSYAYASPRRSSCCQPVSAATPARRAALRPPQGSRSGAISSRRVSSAPRASR
jgi:MFS family permease